jgi:YfiH family protein
MATRVAHRFTDRRHGDLAVDGDPGPLARCRAAVAPGPWTWLRQVHGAEVVVAASPGEGAGAEADAVVTATPGVVVAVHSADCAPLLLRGDGTVGVVHAGWRGLVAGVVEAAAAAMAELGGPPTTAVLGPCIRPRCYEFGPAELALVADRYGPAVEGRTAWGTPALDLGAAVAEACTRLGVELDDAGTCTACSPRHWSHRARADTARQALVAWLEP